MSDSILSVKTVSKSFDKGKTYVFKDTSFSLQKGEVLSVLGESGSGKTTLGRVIAGLETLNFGEISIHGKVVSSKSKFVLPEHRKVGMVFQDYALFPHLSVSKNIGYGLPNKSNKKEKINELLNLVGLVGLDNRYPHQLSGGQQQRVALARTLAANPEIVILDEPFSNLDSSLKTQLRDDVFSILKQKQIASIFITHDEIDAKAVSDTILIFRDGKFSINTSND